MLDSHPNIMIAGETGFMRAAQAQYFIPFWPAGGQWLQRIGLNRAELDESVAAFYADVFGKAAAKKGAIRWGDKTPFHVHHMAIAARIFPDAQFVATVRHPGAVASSVSRFGWDWKKGIEHWIHSNQVMVDHGKDLGDRFHLIRYEDLVLNTELVLREVLTFLGEPWSDQVMAHHEVQSSGVAEGGTRTDVPVDTARIAKWRSNVTDAEVQRLVKATAGQSRIFGYRPEDPMPTEPLGIAGSGLIGVDGNGLAQRFEAAKPVRRVSVNPGFENELYTVAALGEELRKAYVAGRTGGRVRPAYRRFVEKDLPQAAASASGGTVARIRRRVARAISPDA
jgi:hypothetical protein